MTVVPALTVAQDRGLLEAIRRLISSNPELKHLTLSEYLSMATPSPTARFKPRRLAALPSIGTVRSDLRETLSDREFEVVKLVSEGLSNKEISYRLGLSDKTVKNHVSHILAKLNLTARTQVAVLAIRGGIA